MKQWSEIRRRVLVEGVPKRQVLRETGLHWETLEKILSYSSPPGYRQGKARTRPILGEHLEWIEQVLEADKEIPKKKQRHTAHKIFKRLRTERGYRGGYTVVKDFIREYRRTRREVFLPLDHRPGEAQVDFFEALAKIGGELRKVHVFCMALPYSDLFFVKAYPRECTEAFWDGHIEAFRFFGGVPWRISYDNTKIAVRAITGCHARELTDGFLQLVSHYLFETHFCAVRRANEKGVVEGLVRYTRTNFMVPVPQAADYAGLNLGLREQCEGERSRRLRGRGATKGQLFTEEASKLLPLPPTPFEACKRVAVRASSLSLVRFDTNDYSVPVAYAHHLLAVKGFVDRVEVVTPTGERVTEHVRVWEKETVSYKPEHYLALLERKPGGLDHAAPFRDMQLPDCFATLRRKLEAREGRKGTKEYIAVLRLLESHPVSRLARAVERALPLTYPSVGVIRLYVQPEEQPEAPVFCLDGREHLKGVRVDGPDLAAYGSLVGGGVAP